MDESSETSSAKDVPAGSLRTALSELKRLIQSIVDGMEPTVRGQAEKLLIPQDLASGSLKPSTESEANPGTGTFMKPARISPVPMSFESIEGLSARGTGGISLQTPGDKYSPFSM